MLLVLVVVVDPTSFSVVLAGLSLGSVLWSWYLFWVSWTMRRHVLVVGCVWRGAALASLFLAGGLIYVCVAMAVVVVMLLVLCCCFKSEDVPTGVTQEGVVCRLFVFLWVSNALDACRLADVLRVVIVPKVNSLSLTSYHIPFSVLRVSEPGPCLSSSALW